MPLKLRKASVRPELSHPAVRRPNDYGYETRIGSLRASMIGSRSGGPGAVSNDPRLWQLWRAVGELCAVSGVGSVVRGPDLGADPPSLGHVESAGAGPGSDLGRGRL